MQLYSEGFSREREEKNLNRLKTLEQILVLSENHYTVEWMYINRLGNVTVGFNTAGSITPISRNVIRGWQLLGGSENDITIITDITMGIAIENILKRKDKE